jgi:cytochrome c biogenesis protein CcdA
MLELFAEGIESLRLPCSYVILAPAIGIALFARRRSGITIGAFVLAAVLISWLRFAGWWFETPSGLTQILAGAAILVTCTVAFRTDHAVSDAVLGAVTGATAVWSWIPCVGPELGDLLNRVGESPWANAAGTASFMMGLLAPFVILAAAEAAFPRLHELLDQRVFRVLGATLIFMLGLLVMLTLFDDVASELAQRSTF